MKQVVIEDDKLVAGNSSEDGWEVVRIVETLVEDLSKYGVIWLASAKQDNRVEWVALKNLERVNTSIEGTKRVEPKTMIIEGDRVTRHDVRHDPPGRVVIIASSSMEPVVAKVRLECVPERIVWVAYDKLERIEEKIPFGPTSRDHRLSARENRAVARGHSYDCECSICQETQPTRRRVGRVLKVHHPEGCVCQDCATKREEA